MKAEIVKKTECIHYKKDKCLPSTGDEKPTLDPLHPYVFPCLGVCSGIELKDRDRVIDLTSSIGGINGKVGRYSNK